MVRGLIFERSCPWALEPVASTGGLTAGDRQPQVGLWICSFCDGSTSNQQRGKSYDGLWANRFMPRSSVTWAAGPSSTRMCLAFTAWY